MSPGFPRVASTDHLFFQIYWQYRDPNIIHNSTHNSTTASMYMSMLAFTESTERASIAPRFTYIFVTSNGKLRMGMFIITTTIFSKLTGRDQTATQLHRFHHFFRWVYAIIPREVDLPIHKVSIRDQFHHSKYTEGTPIAPLFIISIL